MKINSSYAAVLLATLSISACDDDGSDGIDGTIGTQGAQGEQGPQGAQGEQGPQGVPGAQGPQGVQGLQGIQGDQGVVGLNGTSCWDLDGNGVADSGEDINNDGVTDVQDCRASITNQVIYGDGSADDLIIGAEFSVDWVSNPPSGYPYNNQYQDCTIDALQFRVPSGTVVRCNGNFKVNSLTVAPADLAGADVNTYTHQVNTTKWDSRVNALPELRARETLYAKHLPMWGFRGFDNTNPEATNNMAMQEGWPGGIVYIYAKGSIEIGDILAPGSNGSTDASVGGGSGGLVVLISDTSIEQIDGGVIDVRGGAGSDTELITHAVGGGGGGGIVHLIAPTINVTNINLAGGRGGECVSGQTCDGQEFSLSTHDIGGSGGAYGGHGGAGQTSNGNASNPPLAEAGGDGKLFRYEGNPSDVIDVPNLITK